MILMIKGSREILPTVFTPASDAGLRVQSYFLRGRVHLTLLAFSFLPCVPGVGTQEPSAKQVVYTQVTSPVLQLLILSLPLCF